MSEAAVWIPTPVGSPCWIEIPAVNVPACKRFYSSLFPSWNFKPATAQYPDERIAMFAYGGQSGLNGGIMQVEASCKDGKTHPMGLGVTIYHMVDSIEETKIKIDSLGGKNISDKVPEGDHGYFMYFLDVEGNRFAIYEVEKTSG